MDTWDESVESYRREQAERILAAAVELIAERGVAGLSMSGLAEAAGVARQTLYNYFGDLAAVIGALGERQAEQLFQGITEQIERAGTATEKVAEYVRLVVGHAVHGPGWTGTAAAMAHEMAGEHMRRVDDLLAEILREGMAAGEFRDDLDPAVDSITLRYATNGAMMAIAGGIDQERAADAAVRTILAGVARREAE
jgi:AcrR family transcriptional regulator